MMNKYFKIIGSILTIAFFLFISFGSGESNQQNQQHQESQQSQQGKTSFATSAELWEYIQNENYATLKGVWGEGRVGKPWVSSPTDLGVSVNVYWDNVTCEGKPIKVKFKNDSSEDLTTIATANPAEVQSYNLKGEGAY